MSDNSVLYGLDDRPPLGKATVLGLQHVLTMFGSTVAVPLMFGPQLWPIPQGVSAELQSQLADLQLANTAVLISSVMLCSGVATLLQTTFGSRLPIVQGVSFSFLAAFFAIVANTQEAAGVDWSSVVAGQADASVVKQTVERWQAAGSSGMQTIAGAVLVGGLLEAGIGFSGLMGLVRKILSPVVVGPVIMLIGLALYQVGAPVAAGNWYVSGLMMALIVLFALVLSRHIRLFQLFPMLSAILISVGLCWVLGWQGVVAPGNPAYVDMSAVGQSEWLRTTTIVLPWGWPIFTGSAVVAVLAGYLASMIESFGDYHACKQMAGGGDPTPQEISRGIGCEGIACALTGLLGGFSSTSYSENIGLVGLTKVGSRYVVQVGAVILIVLGLAGKFGALAAAIPQPVVGGLYCALFGLIAAVGVRQFAKADLNSDRNLFIGGFALFMGLSVPFYFANGGAADIAWMSAGMQGLVLAVGSTGMAVAAIIGLTLDNLIPGTAAERGLVNERP